MKLNKIYNIDAIKLLKKMCESNIKVNAIITDPPYNISRKNNFKSIGRNGIYFGDWDNNFNQFEWLKHINDVLLPGGSVIIFNDWKNMGEISKQLEKMDFIVKDLIRWVKHNPMPRNTNRRYVTDYEFAIWAVKSGARWTFNKSNDIPYLRPEYKSSVPGINRIHPTQKSLNLIEEIIKIHTNIGDTILDPFMGSGTTAVACINLERKFIGSEISSIYWNESKKRIDNNDK